MIEMRTTQRLELRQELSLHQLCLLNKLLEMTNAQLFDHLKAFEGNGETGAYPMFSLEKVMTVPRNLDVWVHAGIIREASANYINYAVVNGKGDGKKGKRLFSLLAWMLQVREKMLKVATSFILRYQHDYFWGRQKRLIPISIQGAVNYINDHLEDFFQDNPINYTIFFRVLKNKTISVEGKEYPMRFFFTARKIHIEDAGRMIRAVLEEDPKLSDAKLSEILATKYGHFLARRTVTKYRRGLGISPSNKR